MTDGAGLGITAGRALGTILGGDPSPGEAEQETPEQVRARVDAAVPNDYSSATDCLTRAVLRLYEQRPEARGWPTERVYSWTLPDGTQLADARARELGLWNGEFPEHSSGAVYKPHGPDLSDAVKEVMTDAEREAYDGCTGFMWGFAVNQARWLVGEAPGSNPAIVTIGGSE